MLLFTFIFLLVIFYPVFLVEILLVKIVTADPDNIVLSILQSWCCVFFIFLESTYLLFKVVSFEVTARYSSEVTNFWLDFLRTLIFPDTFCTRFIVGGAHVALLCTSRPECPAICARCTLFIKDLIVV
jgi:hypothetical protein